MNLSVRVEDEYTYFAPGKPLLAGATVKLSNPRRHYSMELITNNDTGISHFKRYINVVKYFNHNLFCKCVPTNCLLITDPFSYYCLIYDILY